MQSLSATSGLSQGKMEDAILFDINQESLTQMNLTEHLSRLDQMSKYLNNAMTNHRQSLSALQQVVKGQINNLKASYQILQNQTKEELERQKNFFEPNIMQERKVISDLKADVQKINAEQLTTKKNTLNLQAEVGRIEGEIGFLELRR